VPPEGAVFFDRWERQGWLEFGAPERERLAAGRGVKRPIVPKAFLPTARVVACHREPRRWKLLYRLLWRLTHGEPRLLDCDGDEDIYFARRLEKQVQRDAQQMTASVRLRQVGRRGEPWFAAWCRPEHRVVRLVAPFFVDRFATMRWTILAPEESVSWDCAQLVFHAGTGRETPGDAGLEEFWMRHYGALFGRAGSRVRGAKLQRVAKSRG